MATPPTFVAGYETAFNTSTTPRTVSVTVAVDDVLVCCGVVENGNATLATPTGVTGVTWTLQQSIVIDANWAASYVWTGTATQAGTFTASIVRSGFAISWGYRVSRFSGSTGIGATAKTNVSGAAPSLAVTTTGDNSALIVNSNDWNAVDGTTRTWRTVNGSPATEATYFRDSATYTVYHGRHADAGTAGSKTVGLSAPAGQILDRGR